MKICVYGISFNNEAVVDDWVQHLSNADYIIVGDIGSFDNTVLLLNNKGISVYNISVYPWRYDVARNTLISNIPNDCDIAVSLDLNQKLSNNWYEHLINEWISGTSKISCPYSSYGRCQVESERIHSARGYHWLRPVHELLNKKPNEQVVRTTNIEIVDTYDFRHGDWTSMLELALFENPTDSELLWRLGATYASQSKWEESAIVHKKNIETGNSAVYKSESMIHLSGLDSEDRFYWLNRAMIETPWRREPYLELATYYYDIKEWNMCLAHANKALDFDQNYSIITDNYKSWKTRVHDIAGLSAYHLKHFSEAVFHYQNAVTLDPNNTRFQKNLTLMKESLNNFKNSGDII